MTRSQWKILDAVCNDCPAWSDGLLARLVHAGNGAAARRDIGLLSRLGLIELRPFAVRTIAVEAVHHRHEPGTSHGDLPRRLSEFAVRRLHNAPRTTVNFAIPTQRAHKLFGEKARAKNPCGFAHDLLLAEACVRTRRWTQGRWVYEAEPPGGRPMFEKQPDAAVLKPSGSPIVFVEAVGAYPADRIDDLMAYADGAGAPIEFW
jgi:hypothetical protein